jgi:branched-chain amino acid transport system ATP-binding protein
MLELHSIVAGYGGSSVINEVSLTVRPNEVLGLIGHNGAGKSTLLKVVSGVLAPYSGGLTFETREVTKATLSERLEMGIAYVPQGNRVFARLTVRENVLVGLGRRSDARKAVDTACDVFPQLAPLLGMFAGLLSGGQKQMLAIASALAMRPRLLLLDEPSLGLAPEAVVKTFDLIRKMRDGGLTMIVAEQHVAEALRVSDHVCALRSGAVVFDGDPSALSTKETLRTVFL